MPLHSSAFKITLYCVIASRFPHILRNIKCIGFKHFSALFNFIY